MEDIKNRFYVYIYLDPRCKGNYSYNNLNMSFLFEPFYIGKGTKNRYKDHLNPKLEKYDSNKFKRHKISNIIKTGIDPFIIFFKSDLTHEEAIHLEMDLIKIIGRHDIGKGPLVNLTDGGEGSYNRKLSDDTKYKISKSRTGSLAWNKGLTKNTDNRILNYSNKNTGKKRSDSFCENISKIRKEYCENNPGILAGENNPMYGISPNEYTLKILKEKFSLEKNPKWVDIPEDKLIILFNSGELIENIAKTFNVESRTISRRIKKLGLSRARPCREETKTLMKSKKQNYDNSLH